MDKKSPVVFLDRDGVLCKEKSYIKSIHELELFGYSREAVRKLKSLGFIVVVITNQSGIARGLIKEEDLAEMNQYIKKETGVDAIYYCPHYPPINHEEEKPPYFIHCNCRKPETDLLKRAESDFLLDLSKAYFVGDRAVDILTGQAIKAVTVLLESGYGTKRLEEQVVPDLIFNDLMEFAEYMEVVLKPNEV